MRIASSVVIALCLMTATNAAQAASCDVRANDLHFGPYNSLKPTPVDSVSTIVVECQTILAAEMAGFSISIDSGVSGSYQPRAMLGAGETLEYNLYVDSPRTTVWGDGSGGSATVGGELSLPAQSSSERILYGRIPPLQPVSPGIYSDSLTVSVEF